MPSTNDYFINLKAQAEASALAKKAAYDAQLAMATGATVNKDTGVISYATDAAGNPKYGTEDVAYQAKQRGTKTGAESSGMLRSGQLASESLANEAAYRAQIAGLASDIAAKKTAVDTDTASTVAEYRALYGNTGASQASSPTAAAPKDSTKMKPITQQPAEPKGSTATKKVGKPQGPSLQGAGKFTPKKSYTPTRIGGY